jgi:hypothetical protein
MNDEKYLDLLKAIEESDTVVINPGMQAALATKGKQAACRSDLEHVDVQRIDVREWLETAYKDHPDALFMFVGRFEKSPSGFITNFEELYFLPRFWEMMRFQPTAFCERVLKEGFPQ